MQLGMIGLGRMGANMVRRLLKGGHQCVVFDRSPRPSRILSKRRPSGARRCKIGQEAATPASPLAHGPGCDRR